MKNHPRFKISTFCGGCSCGCVGVAMEGEAILVTNTTTENSPVTRFTRAEWQAFVAGVKNGEFDVRD